MLRVASKLGRFSHGARPCIGTSAINNATNNNSEEGKTGFAAQPQFFAGMNAASISFDQKRYNSTNAPPTSGDGSELKFEDSMDKLFHDAQKQAEGQGDEWFLEASNAWEPAWYNLADHAVSGVQAIHDMTGWQHATAIFTVTCTLRAFALPLAIRGQRAASRMAHLQPELQQLKTRYESLGTPTQAEQKAFTQQMQAIFAKYEVKPFAAMSAPLIQAPIFLGMFFGMKKMPDLFPTEMSTGGFAWFTDLTISDPTYILPITCGLTFLATIESGKEQMIDGNPQYGPVMVNAFRAMALVMIPFVTTFPAAMLCYWVPNNLITMMQSMMLRNPYMKKQLGIWERPKPVPGATPDVGIQETMNKLVKQVKGEPTTDKEKIKVHNEDIETRKQVRKMSRAARARRRVTVTSKKSP